MIPNGHSGPPEDELNPVDSTEQSQLEAAESAAETVPIEEVLASDVAAAGGLVAELEETRNRLLRTQAELENFRKRARRELEDEQRYASISLMRDLLPVLDNLDRAIEAAEKSSSAAGLLDGVKMVAEQLGGVLKQYHCLPIDAEGQRFNPNIHEAIAQFPSEDHSPGSVMSVTQAGYLLHDRVVRPSQVIVAAPSSSASSGDNEANAS